MSEREVMSRCSHPFIVRMAASYQDGDALYMLLELVPGGELFSLLRQQSYFQEPVAAFYAAIVVAAFEYLHDRQVLENPNPNPNLNPNPNPNPDLNPNPNPNPNQGSSVCGVPLEVGAPKEERVARVHLLRVSVSVRASGYG